MRPLTRTRRRRSAVTAPLALVAGAVVMSVAMSAAIGSVGVASDVAHAQPSIGRTPLQNAPDAASPRDRAPLSGTLLGELAPAAKRPTTAGLEAALAPLVSADALGGRVSVSVHDGATGKALYERSAGTPLIPASTTKLFTATAALSLLGPDHRFTTKVVLNPGDTAEKPVVVLVGGGDPLLSSKAAVARTSNGHVVYPKATLATIDDLAAKTAAALTKSGLTSVALRYDATLFTQPVSPHWRSVYVGSSIVAPVSALWVDQARVKAPLDSRASDPAKDAASRFARLLGKRGITVTGAVAPQQAAKGATDVASVTSPPLDSIVEHVLLTSDNDGAEVLARHTALAAGKPADFAGAMAAVTATVGSLGVDTKGVTLYDGSGLSRDGRLTARSLAEVVELATSDKHPELSSVLSGLPVGGFNGSLATRYRVVATSGAGVVRAKTGTLTGVSSISGTILTKDGALLTFAVMADKVDGTDPRPSADRIAAAIAGCGCRS